MHPDERTVARGPFWPPSRRVWTCGCCVFGEVAGCALWFLNFSTWRGVHGIYVEDLYVQPAHRGKGLGRALLRQLARECNQRGYARLEWAVLNWNEPAIGFYSSLGAEAARRMDDLPAQRRPADQSG